MQKVKNLGVNISKYAQDLQEENYKILVKKQQQELSKWKPIITVLWIGRVPVVESQLVPF